MTKRDLALRLYHLLTQAEMLSEGRTQNFDARISGSREHDGPKGPPSTYDEGVDRIRWVLEELEEAIQREKKRRVKAMTPEEYRYWVVVEHEGKTAEEAAAVEKVHYTTIRLWRSQHGRDPHKGGQPKEKAA